MRTTLTIDDHIAEALKSLARTSGMTFETVVNETLRNGLTTGEQPVPDPEAFRVASAHRGFLPGIDALKLNQLVDELEVDDFAGRRHGESA